MNPTLYQALSELEPHNWISVIIAGIMFLAYSGWLIYKATQGRNQQARISQVITAYALILTAGLCGYGAYVCYTYEEYQIQEKAYVLTHEPIVDVAEDGTVTVSGQPTPDTEVVVFNKVAVIPGNVVQYTFTLAQAQKLSAAILATKDPALIKSSSRFVVTR